MKHNHFPLSLIDMLFNISVTFVALFMLAIISMNPPGKASPHNSDQKAKLLIVMDWGNYSSNDIDLWLKTPEPAKIGYNAPNGRIANLERDDMGIGNSCIQENGKWNCVPLNTETINIRQELNGHYVVDAEFYWRNADPLHGDGLQLGPENVTVQLIQIDPVYKELVQVSFVLKEPRDEHTAFSFDIMNGMVTNIDTVTQDHFVLQSIGRPSTEDAGENPNE